MPSIAPPLAGERATPASHGRVAQRLAWITAFAAALGLCVAVFGAYVRLSDAGLSCPDWPGCYGQLLVPSDSAEVAVANEAFPDRPLDAHRAWLEMAHRYVASVLGFAILIFWVGTLIWRAAPRVSPWWATALLALVIFQGALGMWTVTLMLRPIVVTGHLLGGLTTVALLWWVTLRMRGWQPAGSAALAPSAGLRRWAVAALLVLVMQIVLGAWTSTNYAALACPDFPLCQGQLVPTLALSEALHPWQGTAETFEGGVLDNDARVTIHFLHRVGAVAAALVLSILALRLWRAGGPLRRAGGLVAVLLALQLTLGISNVVLHLPIQVATGHNAGAALLLLTLVSVYHLLLPLRHEPGVSPSPGLAAPEKTI